MAIIAQIPVDLDTHTLHLDTDANQVSFDLFSTDPAVGERATPVLDLVKVGKMVEAIGKAIANAATP